MATGYSIATKITAHDAASQVLRNIQTHLDAMEKKTKSVTSASSRMQSAWTVAAGNMLAAGIQKGVRFVFDSVREVEDATAQFIPKFGGDIEKAKGFVDQLNKAAAATPFQFNDLAKVSDMLMGFGVATEKDVIPQMKIIGDLAGGNAQRFQSIALAYSQSMAAGKANMQDMNQLINAGVPILGQLAKMYKVNVGQIRDMISKGKIMSTDIQRAFKDMTSAGGNFYKGMAIASQTTSGKLSTLEDNMKRAAASMGGSAVRMLSPLVDVLSKIADGFSQMSGVGQSALIALVGAVAMAATSIKTKMAGVALAISGVLSLWQAMDEKSRAASASAQNAVDTIDKDSNKYNDIKKIIDGNVESLSKLEYGTNEYKTAVQNMINDLPLLRNYGASVSSTFENIRLAAFLAKQAMDQMLMRQKQKALTQLHEADIGASRRIFNVLYSRESGMEGAKEIAANAIKRMQLLGDFSRAQKLRQLNLGESLIEKSDKDPEYIKTFKEKFNELYNSATGQMKFDKQGNTTGNINIDINVNQDGKVVSTTATPGRAQGTRFNLQTRTNP
jgi:tape measure domain-containing protein